MQRLEVSGAVRPVWVVRRQTVKARIKRNHDRVIGNTCARKIRRWAE